MEDNGVLMAAEPTMSYSPTVFDTVISYLHASHMPIATKRAVYRQLQTEVADENLGYLKRRLKEFAKLKKGWDGEDAEPVLEKATDNVRQILMACKPSDLTDWALFPNTNGTYLFQKPNAVISVGVSDFTYWAEVDGEDVGEERKPFSVYSVLRAFRAIASY